MRHVAAVLLLAMLVGVVSAQEKPAEPKEKPAAAKVAIGEKAPEFTLKDANGKEHKLADYAGKLVVLEWINFDCPFVKKHYANSGAMPKLQKKYRDQGVVWLTICSSAEGKQGHFTGDALLERIKKEECDAGSYLIDTDGAVGKLYNARTTPEMFVIDKEGKLRYMGAIDDNPKGKGDPAEAKNYVAEALDALIAGKEVTTASTKSYG